jgi:N-carbamoylputrescine amidase
MNVTVAATQFACSSSSAANTDKAEALIRSAAAKGANIILIQELFEAEYFCQEQHDRHFESAHCVTVPSRSGGASSATLQLVPDAFVSRFQRLAQELGVVLPLSFFERSGNSFFNSIVIIDSDGSLLGLYRKSHIPDGPGYQEKFYFRPGDTGFCVWDVTIPNLPQKVRIGVAICWDQWFPEAARIMALKGAELIFYPTAIGTEPQDPTYDSRLHWQRTMQGHAAANLTPVIASNRIGREWTNTFYGHSFIADHTGAVVQQAGTDAEDILVHAFDLAACRRTRINWHVFRDRRADLYAPILSCDGSLHPSTALASADAVPYLPPAPLVPMSDSPSADGFHMPGEFEPQSNVFLGFPSNTGVFRSGAEPARAVMMQAVAAISPTQHVTLVATGTAWHDAMSRVKQLGPAARVSVVDVPCDDGWLRDTAAAVLVRADGRRRERRGVVFSFNAWGKPEEIEHAQDKCVGFKLLQQLRLAAYDFTHFVCEGGSFSVDGQGTCLTTEQCLLNPNRNRQLTKASITDILCRSLGVRKVIWLPFGAAADEDTDGHVDNMCVFARPGEVMLTWPNGCGGGSCVDLEQEKRSLAAMKVLQEETDALGRPFKACAHLPHTHTRTHLPHTHTHTLLRFTNCLTPTSRPTPRRRCCRFLVPLPSRRRPLILTVSLFSCTPLTDPQPGLPGALHRSVGTRLAASHINMLITNTVVLVPTFASSTDAAAVAMVSSIFPDR